VLVPTQYVAVGELFVHDVNKLRSIEAMAKNSAVRAESVQIWLGTSPTPFDKYVRHLWISLRENYTTLRGLGLPVGLSAAVFEDETKFFSAVNATCSGKQF
jgi:hypothetical protein